MMTIKIKPYQIYTNPEMPKANELYLQINSLVPNQYAEFLIMFRNSESGTLYQKVYKMEAQDYLNWNEDIPFLQNWALGVTGTELDNE